MLKYGELNQSLIDYIRIDPHDVIPAEYYRHVIKAAIKANNNGRQWDMQQTAAVLLYFTFNDGILTPSQLTAGGLKALDYAEKFLHEMKISESFSAGKQLHSA